MRQHFCLVLKIHSNTNASYCLSMKYRIKCTGVYFPSDKVPEYYEFSE